MDAIPHFCKLFYVPQNVSHLDQFKQMSAGKRLKLWTQKGMGIMAG